MNGLGLVVLIVFGIIGLWLAWHVLKAGLAGVAFLFSMALAQGFLGIAAFIALWIFLFPVMVVISVVVGLLFGLGFEATEQAGKEETEMNRLIAAEAERKRVELGYD